MKKEELKSEVKCLLHNDYGDCGISGIGNEGISLPEKIRCKHHIGCDWDERYIYEVFCSDTESGVAVSNYKGLTIDFMKLDNATANKVYQAVKKLRTKENCITYK